MSLMGFRAGMRADLEPRCAGQSTKRRKGSDVPDFRLDVRLEADSLHVASLPLSAVRLMRDANYGWLVLVPRRADLVELADLGPADRATLIEEIVAAGEALRATDPCDKLNIAALGNMVRQLHVHVIARRQDDPAWPGPVWGAVAARPYAAGEAEALAERIAARLK
jgi:diadenosine tetraphosphate (Ap4A) HIT family hydrolase